MKRLIFVVAALSGTMVATACTAVIVGKKASATGFVQVGHNEDGPEAVIRHALVPAVDGNLGFYWSEVKQLGETLRPGDVMLNEAGVLVLSNNGGWQKEWCGRKGTLPDEGEFSTLTDGGIGFDLRLTVARKATTARGCRPTGGRT